MNQIDFLGGPERCARCDAPIPITFGRGAKKSVYCSLRCNRMEHRANYTMRDRSRRAGAPIETFARREIFSRDGYACQLCGQIVRSPGPNYPTLDHIIPLGLGGAHCRENSITLCRKCNSDKGLSFIGFAVPLGIGRWVWERIFSIGLRISVHYELGQTYTFAQASSEGFCEWPSSIQAPKRFCLWESPIVPDELFLSSRWKRWP